MPHCVVLKGYCLVLYILYNVCLVLSNIVIFLRLILIFFSLPPAGSGDSGVQCHSISLPAPPTLRPRYCDPNLAYMDRIVLEIVETEAIYVRDLKEIIEVRRCYVVYFSDSSKMRVKDGGEGRQFWILLPVGGLPAS